VRRVAKHAEECGRIGTLPGYSDARQGHCSLGARGLQVEILLFGAGERFGKRERLRLLSRRSAGSPECQKDGGENFEPPSQGSFLPEN